jgi:transcriptional regulator with XRE-family HTH domain
MQSLSVVKNRLHSRLGESLLSARRSSKLTQAQVATTAGCSLPSVAQAEAGLGGSLLFARLAHAVGHELSGRFLVPGIQIGGGLAALRQRRGLSRASVAALAGVSTPTVLSVERDANVHLPGLAAIATVLSAGLRLSPIGRDAGYWTGPATSSVHQGWTTPPDILDRLYAVVGGPFSLDPCSPTADRRSAPVRARIHYTMEDDGLIREWHGSVFCNPPYGRQIANWTAKCRCSVESGSADLVIALLPARSDTSWWHRDVAGRADVFLLRGRLAFGDGVQSAPFASALAVWGASAEIRTALKAAFPAAWHVEGGA